MPQTVPTQTELNKNASRTTWPFQARNSADPRVVLRKRWQTVKPNSNSKFNILWPEVPPKGKVMTTQLHRKRFAASASSDSMVHLSLKVIKSASCLCPERTPNLIKCWHLIAETERPRSWIYSSSWSQHLQRTESLHLPNFSKSLWQFHSLNGNRRTYSSSGCPFLWTFFSF